MDKNKSITNIQDLGLSMLANILLAGSRYYGLFLENFLFLESFLKENFLFLDVFLFFKSFFRILAGSQYPE
jgi:hypothetical protein